MITTVFTATLIVHPTLCRTSVKIHRREGRGLQSLFHLRRGWPGGSSENKKGGL